jgi:dihydrofolate reductase
MSFNLIVAMCRNNGIGLKGKIPWHISEDLKYFSELTKGDRNNAVIMGNKTWQSLPIVKDKPRGLPYRDNFVLSRVDSFDMAINHNHLLKTFKTMEEVEKYIEQTNMHENVWVIGGANIYKQFLEKRKIKYCYVTYIDADFDCDVFFPLLDSTEWKEIERRETYDSSYKCQVSYVVFERLDDDLL